MEYFNIYNKFGEKTDNIIERSDAHKTGICHRVIHLWIINANNELLIQQRSSNKDMGADLWYVSVAGHIDASESIEITLVRETKEELGLDISHLADFIKYLYTFLECTHYDDSSYIDNEIYDVFLLKADFNIDEIIMQAEEVQAVKYIKYDEFKNVVLTEDKSFWQHKLGYKMLLAALDNYFSKP